MKNLNDPIQNLTVTFQLAAQCPNQLRHHVSQDLTAGALRYKPTVSHLHQSPQLSLQL
jgi:hypothetical protein